MGRRISLVIPIRGDRDIRPLVNSVPDFVEIVPVRYEYSIWNISRATNIGIKKCTGEIIAKVDADLTLPAGFIDDVLGAGERFCVAPVRRQEDGQLAAAAWDNPVWGNLRSWHWPCGGWQSAPREFWFDLRGYDESMIFYGAEDTDLWRRAYRAGIPVEIMSPVLHRHHALMAHKWGFFHTGNCKLREARRESLVRNPATWGRGPLKPGIELVRWLLNVITAITDIRNGTVGGLGWEEEQALYAPQYCEEKQNEITNKT